MDTPKLSENLISAGRAYYDALRKLGFNPEGLFWAYDVKEDNFRLWLVWSGLDRYGPLAISKLLFKAYRSSALPVEIDPFTVYVVTQEHMIGSLSKSMNVKLPNNEDALFWRVQNNNHDILHTVDRKWVYHIDKKRSNTKKIDKEWRSFNDNVSALAA